MCLFQYWDVFFVQRTCKPLSRILKFILVSLESVQISTKIGTRQGTRPKPVIPAFSRVLASGGTLELDLREDLTKKIFMNIDLT